MIRPLFCLLAGLWVHALASASMSTIISLSAAPVAIVGAADAWTKIGRGYAAFTTGFYLRATQHGFHLHSPNGSEPAKTPFAYSHPE